MVSAEPRLGNTALEKSQINNILPFKVKKKYLNWLLFMQIFLTDPP